jgi:hypothetical protein
MAITYTTPWPDMPTVKVPKLHKIKYADTVDGVLAMYQRSYKDHLVDEWLKANCNSPYYHSPGWMKEKFIQFEDDKEAVMFALMVDSLKGKI